MKKLYTLGACLLFTAFLMAQTSVTFQLNLGETTASVDGVHIAGNFDINGDSYPNFDPAGIALSDDNMDNIWEVELLLSPGDYEYKYINGNMWGMDEGVPDACVVPGSFNRGVSVGTDALVLDPVCPGQCADCGMRYVLFQADLSLEEAINPNGVHVVGSFQGWDPGSSEMTDPDEDLVFTYAYAYTPDDIMLNDTLIFKYNNDNDWNGFEESIAGDCSDGDGNRQEVISETATVLTSYCYNTCGSCVAPVQVTFQVDMSLETVGANGVHLAGAFQGWDPATTEMTDTDLDGIYEVVLELAPGSYEYKHVNGNSWDDPNENTPAECNVNGNRLIEVVEEAMTVTHCYNQCSSGCIEDPSAADITFRLDMSAEEVSADGVWLIGGFTNPAWQSGATEMTDIDLDGIYEATLNVDGSANIQYKFVNGDVSVVENEENAGIETCGIANGIGGFNRTHTRSGEAEILDVACFDQCECSINVQELEIVNSLSIYPNPAQSQVTVNFVSESVTSISLVNALGQVVYNQGLISTGENTIELTVSNLATGLYTVQLSGQNISVNRMLVIE